MVDAFLIGMGVAWFGFAVAIFTGRLIAGLIVVAWCAIVRLPLWLARALWRRLARGSP